MLKMDTWLSLCILFDWGEKELFFKELTAFLSLFSGVYDFLESKLECAGTRWGHAVHFYRKTSAAQKSGADELRTR